jgi:hypothetical protein
VSGVVTFTMAMREQQMTAELAELQSIAENLPPELVRKVIDFARGLTSASAAGGVEMYELTEEEMREEANRAMQRFEEEHPGEDWSHLRPTPGYE